MHFDWAFTVKITPITPRIGTYHPYAIGFASLLTIIDIVSILSQGLHQLLRVSIDLLLLFTQVLHYFTQGLTNTQLRQLTSIFHLEVSAVERPENHDQLIKQSEELIKQVIRYQTHSERMEALWLALLILRLFLLQWFLPTRLTFAIANFRNAAIRTIPFLLRLTLPMYILSTMLFLLMGHEIRKLSTFTGALFYLWQFLIGDFSHVDFKNQEVLFVFLTFILFVIITQFIIALFLASASGSAERCDITASDGPKKAPTDKSEADLNLFLEVLREEVMIE
ncbi:hypothetical protein Pcinc_020856 [Petrolisthes cinctipes]|uniref:Uncharacterized protein n=1 Tax=Petrolisthes cinctipes TaxID=88211 RepID=A0AAE1FH24_PETCI|nr:hypothetical protein Pcinc_020856 [Petrolisthes cinctipes]